MRRRRPAPDNCVWCGKPRSKWRRLTGHNSAAYCSMKCVYKAQPIKGRCHSIVFAMVALGLLPKARTQACVDCGEKAVCYDHRDYGKPEAVDAVCHSCNIMRGPGVFPKVCA